MDEATIVLQSQTEALRKAVITRLKAERYDHPAFISALAVMEGLKGANVVIMYRFGFPFDAFHIMAAALTRLLFAERDSLGLRAIRLCLLELKRLSDANPPVAQNTKETLSRLWAGHDSPDWARLT